jgi:hypothetical protein
VLHHVTILDNSVAFLKFFRLLLFKGTFTSFFKDKKSKTSHRTVGMKVFLLFLFDEIMKEGTGS